MWKKVIFVFFIACLLSALLIGCGGVTPPPSDDLTETIIPETTKVVDEESEQAITFVSEDQSIITFDESTSQLEELTPGDVIVIGVTDQTPCGLLRKVKNVSNVGNVVIVETEFASLEEAIEQGSFEFDITLEPEDIERNVSYPKGVRLIRDKFETGYSFSYELDRVLCNSHLIVDGELSFDYHILLNGTIGFFKLKTLEFKNTVESKAELDITLTDSFSAGDLLDDNPKTIFTIPFKKITVWVSYVPIVLKPQIDINVGLDGEIFAELTTGVTISQEDEGAYVAGVEFDNGTWKEIKNEPVFTFEYREPSLSADAKIKAYAGPQLELMLYGIAGPHCNIYGYLDFEADIWDDPWWELYAGLDVTAGLQLEIITKFWSAVYSSPEFDIINYRTPEPIAQADGPFISLNHDPVISNLTANPSSVDINQSSTISCTASDEDVGDTLTYTWTKNGGTISGSGSSITWTAPSTAGTYTITCTVFDGNGGEDSESVNIEVFELDDETKITNTINGFWQAINDRDWDESKGYCIYDSEIYQEIVNIEQCYNLYGSYECDIPDNIVVNNINPIIINGDYVEACVYLTTIWGGVETSGEGWLYLQKIGNDWKLYGYGETATPPSEGEGSISGKIYDAVTGEELENARIEIVDLQEITYSSSDGSYTFTGIPQGDYQIEVSKIGYQTSVNNNVSVVSGEEISNVNFYLSPTINQGEYRIILSWGENPCDLDAHLWIPNGEHCYFDHKTVSGANLDYDDTTSYGPETITITQIFSGTYTYAVKHYSGSGKITTSGAKVEVYNDSGKIRTYEVNPNASCGEDGWYWTVFELDGSSGTVTTINTFSSSSPRSMNDEELLFEKKVDF